MLCRKAWGYGILSIDQIAWMQCHLVLTVDGECAESSMHLPKHADHAVNARVMNKVASMRHAMTSQRSSIKVGNHECSLTRCCEGTRPPTLTW